MSILRSQIVAAAVVACLLVPVLGASAAGAQTSSGSGVTGQDISVRDQLIASQENLLNTYRCLFGVDTHVVPNGCELPAIIKAGVPPQHPTQLDLDLRDGLIRGQEALLNIYRCRFVIDTQLVPGGCTDDGKPATPEEPPGADDTPETTPEPQDDDTTEPQEDDTPETENDDTPETTPEPEDDDTSETTPEPQDDDTFTISEGPRGDDTLISVGRGRTCAVQLDGGVACWGQYGLVERFALAGLHDVVAITSGDNQHSPLHACLLHEDRTISCWGDGDGGKLGQGDPSNHFLPVKVPRINDAVAVSAGASHTCALHDDGGVSCWGWNSAGQAGGPANPSYSPQRVPGLSDVVMISAGGINSCAVHSDGDMSCWGAPFSEAGSSPKKFSFSHAFTSVSNGKDRTCGVTVDGSVYCWWRWDPESPNRIESLTDVVDVSVGNANTCVLHRDGGVSCWGRNEAGEVGDGTQIPREQPHRIAGISDAVAISVSMGSENITSHVCALRSNGSALCWGGNESGQLGDGTHQRQLVPTAVKPIVGISADQVPLTATELLRKWAEAVVQEHEVDFPWMRVAWNQIRAQAIAVHSGYGGLVFRHCYASSDKFGCDVTEMHITSLEPGVFVHELLHVFDLQTGLAPNKAWGAVQLYFATTHPGCWDGGGEISGAEILADTVNHLVIPAAWLTYYQSPSCPTLPAGSQPSAEAEQVVLQGMAGQVPDWYTENITNGAELWAAWLRGPSIVALANLADEFGGLCSTDWIRYPLEPERFPPAGSNPFRDGGC